VGGDILGRLNQASSDPLAKHSLSPSELQAVLAAERAHEPFLAVRDGAGQLQVIVLAGDTERLTVGRRPEMDVSIGWDAEVSGLHAELQAFSGEWTILDDGLSTNGTFVNGNRVRGRQRLRDGDRVRVGRTLLVYRSVDPLPVPSTAPTGEQPSAAQLTDTQRRVLIALCRPYRDGDRFATPSSNAQIAAELFLSVDAVKAHLRVLFTKFELGDLPQHEKRLRLAECVMQYGLISPHDLD
jgi:pSer/pThr/pTyr-binding forkhead associated (FHA) protein